MLIKFGWHPLTRSSVMLRTDGHADTRTHTDGWSQCLLCLHTHACEQVMTTESALTMPRRNAINQLQSLSNELPADSKTVPTSSLHACRLYFIASTLELSKLATRVKMGYRIVIRWTVMAHALRSRSLWGLVTWSWTYSPRSGTGTCVCHHIMRTVRIWTFRPFVLEYKIMDQQTNRQRYADLVAMTFNLLTYSHMTISGTPFLPSLKTVRQS